MFASIARPLVAAAVLSIPAGPPAWAQVDYRNLDDGRPTRVTDAYPIERFAFELSVPYRVGLRGDVARQRAAPHLDYGIAPNLMIGAGLDLALGGRGSEPSHGRLSGLWNARRETVSFPAVSVAVEASGRSLASATVLAAAIATRSVGRSRFHANVAASLAAPGNGTERTEPRWWAGVAWDRTLFRTSTVVIADLTVSRVDTGLPVEVIIGAGLRRQVTPTLVFHGGLAQGLTNSNDGLEVNLGLSHAFAVAGLMRGGRR